MSLVDLFSAGSKTNGVCGKNLTWKLVGDTLTISGTGEMESRTVPLLVPWFKKRALIKKVLIENGVSSIGDHAFCGHENLNNVSIPDSITKIGDAAFFRCTSLTNVIIPKNVMSIGGMAFECCSKLTSISIPDSVKEIYSSAFSNCTDLTSVTIGGGVTSIGELAFGNCTSLREVIIPSSVRKLGKAARRLSEKIIYALGAEDFDINNPFRGCTGLKEIYYPAGRGFEKNLSQGNNAKLIPYTVPSPVTQPTTQTVNELKFYPVQPPPQQPKFYLVQSTKPVAEKLTWSFANKTLTVGGGRVIENLPYAKIPWVDHLHDIQRIVIGNGVEKISAHAFDDCTRLELLELPASVKTIGDMAFSVCFCGNTLKNVFWCLEDGVLVLKKNPDAPPAADFSTGAVSWIFAEKNIRSIKIEDGVKPTEKFFSWLTQRFNGKKISFE